MRPLPSDWKSPLGMEQSCDGSMISVKDGKETEKGEKYIVATWRLRQSHQNAFSGFEDGLGKLVSAWALKMAWSTWARAPAVCVLWPLLMENVLPPGAVGWAFTS